MLALGAVILVLYAVRLVAAGRARSERVDAAGAGVFVRKETMELGYWMMNPIVGALVALRVTPNAVTLFSLVPAALAAVAAGVGWFGLAFLFGALAALSDLVDGVLARRTGVASEAGEVIDAAVDRYAELMFLGGFAVHYRDHLVIFLLTLAAMMGSLTFSLTTARAEAALVTLPRAPMRRAERAIYLLFGAGLTPITRSLFAESPYALRELPILLALVLVAAATNVSTFRRRILIAETRRERRRVAAAAVAVPR